MSDGDSNASSDGWAEPDVEGANYGVNGKCFVIAPIGSNDTDTRNRTDDLMSYVIKPVVEDGFELDVEIAHDIDEPGNITRQVMELLFEADLVIADLTEQNPNVMYELAVRHATGKPVVTIANSGTTLPFDIGPQRTKFYELEFGGAEEFKKTLRSAIEKALQEDHEPDNPIQQVRKGFTLKKVMARKEEKLPGEADLARSDIADVSQSPDVFNFAFQQGEGFLVDIIIEDDEGNPIDLSANSNHKFIVYAGSSAETMVKTYTPPELEIEPDTQGQIKVALQPNDTEDWGPDYFYRYRSTRPNGLPRTYSEGDIEATR